MTLCLGTATWLFSSVVLNNIETIDISIIASNWRGNMRPFICPRALSVPRIFEHIFPPNGCYCVNYSSNIFRKTSVFKN